MTTTFRGTDDTGHRADPLDPENLRALLAQGGSELLVEEVADAGVDPTPTTGRTVRARRGEGEHWTVEVRPAEGPVLRSGTPNTDATFDLVRSWCADDGWWRDAFSWESVDV